MITDFYFTFAEPYYEDEFEDFGTYHMRIFFKYTNDNNPFNEASISPLTVMDGVSQIGGFFAILGLLKLFLFFYNSVDFFVESKELLGVNHVLTGATSHSGLAEAALTPLPLIGTCPQGVLEVVPIFLLFLFELLLVA